MRWEFSFNELVGNRKRETSAKAVIHAVRCVRVRASPGASDSIGAREKRFFRFQLLRAMTMLIDQSKSVVANIRKTKVGAAQP